MKEQKPLWFTEYEKRVEIQIGRVADSVNHAMTLFDERDKASKLAIKAAFESAERAALETKESLKEYKLASNEWRATVNDLASKQVGRGETAKETRETGRDTRAQSNWGIERILFVASVLGGWVLAIVVILRK